MKDRAHITVKPKRKVIFRGADMVAEIVKLKAEIERLKKLDEISSEAHDANLLEMADMRTVICRLTAENDAEIELFEKLRAERDTAYVRGLKRGLKRAKEITVEKLVDCSIEEEHTIKELQDSIQAEIDKAKASKL